MTTLINIEHLSCEFPAPGNKTIRAVNDVSFSIAENEVLGLVGESGSGKTTLGKMLVGLEDKTGGEVHYRGELLAQMYQAPDFRRYAGIMQMIFQDPYSSLNPAMTVADIIGEGLRLAGQSDNINKRIAMWLQKTGLSPQHMSRYPHEFSGGQRQRIGIARALILAPEFVVCDEPVSALDVSVQAQIVTLLRELQSSMQLTLLFIAHDLSMVRYVSDRICVFYLGQVVEIGTADAVYFQPRHPYSQMLIASVPQPDPHQRQSSLPVKDTEPSSTAPEVGCCFAGRCPKAIPVCTKQRPPLYSLTADIDPKRQVACHLFAPERVDETLGNLARNL